MLEADKGRFTKAKSSLADAILSAKKSLTSSGIKAALQGLSQAFDEREQREGKTSRKAAVEVSASTTTQVSGGDTQQPQAKKSGSLPAMQTLARTQEAYLWDGLTGGVTSVGTHEHTAAVPPAPTAPRDHDKGTENTAHSPKGEDSVGLDGVSKVLERGEALTSASSGPLDEARGEKPPPSTEVANVEEEADKEDHEG
jgi:hypothetical protein